MVNSKPSDNPTPHLGGVAATSSPDPLSAATPLAARKPMARATRITLFEREVRERLSRAALDLVFARAEVISEGQRSQRGGKESYFGSTMLTIDLPALAVRLRDAPDVGTARRLATLLETDGGVAQRITSLAESEAARICGASPSKVNTHTTIRAQGAKVYIDVDVEAGF